MSTPSDQKNLETRKWSGLDISKFGKRWRLMIFLLGEATYIYIPATFTWCQYNWKMMFSMNYWLKNCMKLIKVKVPGIVEASKAKISFNLKILICNLWCAFEIKYLFIHWNKLFLTGCFYAYSKWPIIKAFV